MRGFLGRGLSIASRLSQSVTWLLISTHRSALQMRAGSECTICNAPSRRRSVQILIAEERGPGSRIVVVLQDTEDLARESEKPMRLRIGVSHECGYLYRQALEISLRGVWLS